MKKFASFVPFVFVAALLVACDDDSVSNSVTDSDEVSSSSVCKNCDDLSSSKAKSSSSSSVTPKSSDSETSVSSSSTKPGSSSVESSSSSSVPEGYVDPSTVVTGTMTDERDGQTYKTVTIGTQTWMAENLNYAYTGVPYSYNRNDHHYTSDSTSWCYKDSAEYCTKYGRLYTWATAMDSAGLWSTNSKGCGYFGNCSPTYPIRGICPEGWHLPKLAEWDVLMTAVGGQSAAGKMLKSDSGWNDYYGKNDNGTDAYFFSALPAGRRYGNFVSQGTYAFFWSSTEFDALNAIGISLHSSDDDMHRNGYYKDHGHSVRCVQDSE